ncbi:hypothetical protein L1987_50972 [Smallanthus sonchifolius]|uniref:Uncharacterized protein n=1 Tax=Smallanthus sonchifolius TaxID=185202 RepID=A0ACB9EP30_9ASTR|nr:hypothetical protein L1987_50972 [Smallanthus sonchifolius]
MFPAFIWDLRLSGVQAVLSHWGGRGHRGRRETVKHLPLLTSMIERSRLGNGTRCLMWRRRREWVCGNGGCDMDLIWSLSDMVTKVVWGRRNASHWWWWQFRS